MMAWWSIQGKSITSWIKAMSSPSESLSKKSELSVSFHAPKHHVVRHPNDVDHLLCSIFVLPNDVNKTFARRGQSQKKISNKVTDPVWEPHIHQHTYTNGIPYNYIQVELKESGLYHPLTIGATRGKREGACALSPATNK
jgi:hypothetical protein